MANICDPCESFVCSQNLPECGLTLNLGQDNSDTPSGSYTAYIQYSIGGDAVVLSQDFEADYFGDLIIDITTPTKEHYSSFNGLYKIWVTNQGGQYNEKIEMIKDTVTTEIWAVKFEKVTGSTLEALEIIPVENTCA